MSKQDKYKPNYKCILNGYYASETYLYRFQISCAFLHETINLQANYKNAKTIL